MFDFTDISDNSDNSDFNSVSFSNFKLKQILNSHRCPNLFII